VSEGLSMKDLMIFLEQMKAKTKENLTLVKRLEAKLRQDGGRHG
jgi:hypothetical protein